MIKNVSNFLAVLGLVAALDACDARTPFALDAVEGATSDAIVNGQLDGEDHPAVVLLSMQEPNKALWRCSATMISPTIAVTAGHCTGEGGDAGGTFTGEFDRLRIFTGARIDGGDNDFPNAGPNAYDAIAFYTHPEYTSAAFNRHDVGVVVLAEPGIPFPAGFAFPTLPGQDALDAFHSGDHTRFTSVGYGMQDIKPRQVAVKVRMRATPELLQINVPGDTGDFSLTLSSNPKTGGVCFGDSGGPSFLGDSNVIAGVASFVRNGTCAGQGGVFRLDRASARGFVQSVIDGAPWRDRDPR